MHPALVLTCLFGTACVVGGGSSRAPSAQSPALSRERWKKAAVDKVVISELKAGNRNTEQIIAVVITEVYPGAHRDDPVLARTTLRAMRHVLAVLDEEAEDNWYEEGGR